MSERDLFDNEQKQVVARGTKAVEDAVKHSIQSRARDDSDIGLGGVGGVGGLLTYLFRAGELVAPWWSTQRDIDLRRFVKSSDHLSGTVGLLTSKVINVPVRVEPRDYSLKTHMKQADEYTRRLMEESEFGQTWITFASKILEDWFKCDNGMFMEVIGDGRKDGPIQGPALGLAALDSTKITRKKNPEYPIAYIDEDGYQYKLHHTRVAYAADQPSNIVEMRGIGFSSVSRTINVAQNLVDMSIYNQEKLGSRPMRAILFTPGIPTDVVEATMQMSAEMMDNQGLRRFSKMPILGGNSTDADVRLIPLSSVPDGFDQETATRLAMFAMALGFGVPIRWIWPAATSGATKADAMYQHIAGLGGGIGRVLNVLTLILGGDPRGSRHTIGKFLPPHLKLVFDFQDDEQDRMKAEIEERRMTTMATALETGVITLRVAREKALDAGDLTQAQFDQMELTDGRLPSGEDVLTLFYAGDRAMRELLDLGVEDALDVGQNDSIEMLGLIEEKQAEVRKILSETGAASRKKAIKQALAALGKLREAYEEGQSAQQQADDAETEEQASGEDQPQVEEQGDGQGSPVVEKEDGEETQVEKEEEEVEEKAFLDGVRVAWEAIARGFKGGPGSGHHGHGGRPGKRGGSAPSGGTAPSFMMDSDDPSSWLSSDDYTAEMADEEYSTGYNQWEADARNYMEGWETDFDTTDFDFVTRCVESDAVSINDMVTLAEDIDRDEFLEHVNSDTMEWMEEEFGYTDDGLRMEDDWHVSYHRSMYRGVPAYYFVHSAIEHVFISPDWQQEAEGNAPGQKSVTGYKVWSSLDTVPKHLRRMHNVPLTLPQINHMASIGDAVEKAGDVDNPWAVARTQFQKLYHIEDGQWVRRKKDTDKDDKKETVLTQLQADVKQIGTNVRDQLSRTANSIIGVFNRERQRDKVQEAINAVKSAARAIEMETRVKEVTSQPQPELHVNVSPPNVTVGAPTINLPDQHTVVEAAPTPEVHIHQKVMPPDVNIGETVVNAPPVTINQEAPQVDVHFKAEIPEMPEIKVPEINPVFNVPPAQVHVDAELRMPDETIETETMIERSPTTGKIAKTTKTSRKVSE